VSRSAARKIENSGSARVTVVSAIMYSVVFYPHFSVALEMIHARRKVNTHGQLLLPTCMFMHDVQRIKRHSMPFVHSA
jgi:hypothetical protein